jgi:hypothetical protein
LASLFNSETFADRAAESLADPRVSSYAANVVADAVIQADRDLTMVRPLIHATAEFIVSSGPFRALARRAFRRGHQLMLTEGGRGVLLSVSDVGLIARSALASRPEIAEKVPTEVTAVITALHEGPGVELSAKLLRLGHQLGTYSLVTFWLGFGLLLLAILSAVNRRLAVFRAGMSFVVAGLLILLIEQFGGSVIMAVAKDNAIGGAMAGLWDSFTTGLRARALALGGVGILMMAAATAFLERVRLAAFVTSIRPVLWETTEKKLLLLLRILILIGAGTVAILEPGAVARVLVVVAGGLALFLGLRELFHLIFPLVTEPVTGDASRQVTAHGRISSPARIAVGGVVILAFLISGIAIFARTPSLSSEVKTVGAVNGHAELADRRLDEVVLPAAHNAMSSADISNWMFPNQERGVIQQLQMGIRGLLIDVYSGIPMGNAVKTDLDDDEIARDKYVPMLGETGVDAAIRIRDRLVGGEESDRALYMCHGLCELGSTELIPKLAEIREFLVMNPNEVLIIMIEDYAPPEEIEAAFEESGLIDFVYKRALGPPWPTLREMVLADERVLVLAEHDAHGVPWYHQAFEVFQETPYHFERPEDFSNEPNRGGTAGSLLLMNHWIASIPSSLPSDAEDVNTYEVLLARARACEEERGQLPTLIAVDFHRTGDLLRVVRTLNGIPEP